MLCDSIGHRTRKTYFGNGGMEKPTEPTAGRGLSSIADALGDDASVVETVIADRERKLSGHVEPAWSVELQTILNRYDSEEERVERTGYATAFAPFVAYVKAELQAYMSACSLPMNDERLIEQCLSAYVERLLGIGLKTVVWELHVARQAGSLGDGDAKRQLRRYFELLATDEYRGHMYAKYPVLLRFVTQTTVHYIDFVKEMLDRVSMDRDELASFAGVGDDFRLEDMSIDRGDAHDGGRAVAMLTIGGRKIVYKPRDLHIHELFAGLVRRCERTKGFLPMRVSDVLTKSGYAYEEFVEHGTCEDARQVERYYTRYGQLLGLVWLLHGDDMHHENIIASGEYPMVVDFETIATNHVTMDMPDGTDATSAYPRYCGIRWHPPVCCRRKRRCRPTVHPSTSAPSKPVSRRCPASSRPRWDWTPPMPITRGTP